MSNSEHDIERISQVYRQKIPSKLQDLSITYQSINVARWSPSNLAPLMRKLHALRGSAGTFGLKKLSNAVGAIERDLALIAARPNGPSLPSWRLIGDNIRRLANLDLSDPNEQAVDIFPTQEVRSSERAKLVDLIEDDLDESEFIAQIVSQAGFEVRRFSSGRQYRESWEQPEFVRPDAIIMDMVMDDGEKAGVETIKAIQPDQMSSPVIFLSQRSDMEARLEALESGATRYLAKPVDTGHLINLLDAITGRQPEEPYRVLLVDDEQELLELEAAALRMAGMNVETLNDPMQTIKALRHFDPDVLILDVYMPEVSGPEIAAIIRDSDEYLNLPILFMSAETQVGQQLMALNLGGDDFIEKPVRQDHLVAAVTARARRARQNQVLSQRLAGLMGQVAGFRSAFDRLGISISFDRQKRISGVNERFESEIGNFAADFKSRIVTQLGFRTADGRNFEEIIDSVIDGDSWQGRVELKSSETLRQYQVSIFGVHSFGSDQNQEFWILGTAG